MIYIEQEDGNLVLGGVPNSKSNRHYSAALQEVKDGTSTIETWEGSQRQVDSIRQKSIANVKSEGIKRIGTAVNIIPEIDMTASAVFSYQHAWPVTNASAALTAGKAIYDYTVTKIGQARGATKEQLEGYNPLTDSGWPQDISE